MPNDTTPKRKKGRPTKKNDAILKAILDLAAKGRTDKEIAKLTGITETTLNLWKKQDIGFSVSIKEAKELADDLVEASLFQRALGYTHPAVKIMQSEGVVIKEEYVEHYPPDTQAARFWLMNRRPKEWRERQTIEHTGADGKPIQVQEVSKEQAMAMAKATLKAAEHDEQE